MIKTSASNRTHNPDQPIGTGTDDAFGWQEGRKRRINGTALSSRKAALALHMGLPGTRPDMALGATHPLLLEIVHSLARREARASHAQTLNALSDLPTPTRANKEEN